MPNNMYITKEVIERANQRSVQDKGKGLDNVYNPQTHSFNISINYQGETIQQNTTIEQLKKAFYNALKNNGY